jgi:hypothetical protein
MKETCQTRCRTRLLQEVKWAPRIAFVALLPLLGGCKEIPTQPQPAPPIDSPAAVVGALADAYRMLDASRFERLISQEPGAEFTFQIAEPLPSGQTGWDAASALNIHQRMLVSPTAKTTQVGIEAAPVPAELRLTRISIDLVPVQAFTELETPAGLDPARWRAFTATYEHHVLFDTQSRAGYLAAGQSQFVVIEDLSKSDAEAGRFSLYSWRDLGMVNGMIGARPAAVEEVLWGNFQMLYAGSGPVSPEEFIQGLAGAYRNQDYSAFEALFPEPGSDTPYLYFLPEPLPNGQTSWDRTEELLIHRRMFEPENPLPGETPVPQEYWLVSITINLTPIGSFTERPDLYRSPANPDGVDAERWRAIEAQYQAIIFFDTQGTTDFRVDGKESFVVLDLRQRLEGVPGKYCLYRWEDLGASAVADEAASLAVQATSWSGVKSLYAH